MSAIKLILPILILVFININCKPVATRTITYEVSGNASSITIKTTETGEITVTLLPWTYSVEVEVYADNNDGRALSAKNNTADNSTITAKIYVDDVLHDEKSVTGPYASVEVTASFFCEECDGHGG